VVDPEEMQYFGVLSDYIHLNPARAGIVSAEETLADYAWSSYLAYLRKAKRPEWLVTDVVLGELGMEDSAAGRRHCAKRREARAQEGRTSAPAAELVQLRRGWCLGGEKFRARVLRMLEGKGMAKKANRDAEVRRDHAEVEARRLLDCGLELLGLEAVELERLPRGDERKLALAAVIRSRIAVSSGWPAAALRMGHPSRVTTSLRMPKTHALRRKLEAALAS